MKQMVKSSSWISLSIIIYHSFAYMPPISPHLHKCLDTGEAYAAAFLITREHITHQNTAYNLTWVNCEMGSFIMMNPRAKLDRNSNGTVIQSLDVLSFSMIHLSWFERLQNRYRIKRAKGAADNSLWNISSATEIVRKRALRASRLTLPIEIAELNRTVVIMPWLGSDHGAGHSKIQNRLLYLEACVWSLYKDFKHIVVMVKSVRDVQILRNESTLPLFDVILIEGLPKSASLPVATVQQAKRKIADGSWSFDFVFFTESDQMLVMNNPSLVYSHLHTHSRHVIIPHRLVPYPHEVLRHNHNRSLSYQSLMDWKDMHCCIPRQHCQERKTWVSVKNVSVPIVQIFGLQIALGNINFHEEKLRPCTLTKSTNAPLICP